MSPLVTGALVVIGVNGIAILIYYILNIPGSHILNKWRLNEKRSYLDCTDFSHGNIDGVGIL